MAKRSKKVSEILTPDTVHPDSRLTPKDVKAIRDDYAKGMTFADLAVKHKMSTSMARDIALGRLFA